MQKTIQKVHLVNFKKHKDLLFDTEGKTFMIIGSNGAGKSTVLQAIDHMIRNTPLPDAPVTDGEDSGKIELMLAANGDTYRVSRSFTKDRMGRFELRKMDDMGRMQTLTPAAEIFAEIFGKSLDLSGLIDMDGKQQMDTIQSLVSKDGEVKERIAAIQKRVKSLKEERLLCGRDLRDDKAKMNVPEFRELVNYVGEEMKRFDLIKNKMIDVAQLRSELASIKAKNQVALNCTNSLRSIADTMKSSFSDFNARDIAVAIVSIEKMLTDTSAMEEQLNKAAETNATVSVELRDAEDFNRKVERSKEYTATQERIEQLEKKYDSYTDAIAAELGSISTAMTSIGLQDIYPDLELKYEMDEEGSVTKQGLYLRGLPFNRRQQSYAEMVRILVMLSKAFNPDGFNFLSIGDWNLLDEETAATILEIAEANDIQLGIEKVDSQKELVLQIVEK